MAEETADWRPWGIPLIVIACILILILCLYLFSRWMRGPMYKGTARLDGKVVVITGANTGIGKETAIDLSQRGARIIMLCRDMEKAKKAADEIMETTKGSVEYLQLDLSSLESVRKCAEILKEKEPQIDILINNAGIMTCPQWETKDGFEMQFGTNHLGHFLLTTLLLENIKAAAPSRIVNLSSLAHRGGRMHFDDLNLRKNYSPHDAYNQSKLSNILFTKSLTKKLEGTGVTTYAVHPGVVNTELFRHIGTGYCNCLARFLALIVPYFSKTPVLGAQTSIYCAVDEKLADETGKYYGDCHEINPSARARNEEDAEKLWNMSMEMVNGTTLQDV